VDFEYYPSFKFWFIDNIDLELTAELIEDLWQYFASDIYNICTSNCDSPSDFAGLVYSKGNWLNFNEFRYQMVIEAIRILKSRVNTER
jgi:hypothetical protein